MHQPPVQFHLCVSKALLRTEREGSPRICKGQTRENRTSWTKGREIEGERWKYNKGRILATKISNTWSHFSYSSPWVQLHLLQLWTTELRDKGGKRNSLEQWFSTCGSHKQKTQISADPRNWASPQQQKYSYKVAPKIDFLEVPKTTDLEGQKNVAL